MKKKPNPKPPAPAFDVHPGVVKTRAWIDSLPSKTGRSLDEWLELVRTEGPATEKERAAWLKNVHGFGTHSAVWIAARVKGKGVEDEDPAAYLVQAAAWADALFSGKKAGLRPLFDELVRLGRGLGPDVKVSPCKTMVPFYRQHVFVQLKPTTNTRVDLGLALGDTPAVGRLIDTGGLARKDRITHRIPVSRPDEIDDELMRWLRAAYERDA